MESDYKKRCKDFEESIKKEYGQDVFENPKVVNFKNSRSAHFMFIFKLQTNRLKKIISKSIIKLWKKQLKITE